MLKKYDKFEVRWLNPPTAIDILICSAQKINDTFNLSIKKLKFAFTIN